MPNRVYDIPRSAKSAEAWKQSDLETYNINIQFRNATTFFKTPVLPPPAIDEELLTTDFDAKTLAAEKNRKFLIYLKLAMNPKESESAIGDFAVLLFRALGYEHHSHTTRTSKGMKILICGQYKGAKTSVCVIDADSEEVLLVQENSHIEPKRDLMAAGLDPLENKIIPAVVMTGTSPIFLKIPVTTQLDKCVQCAKYPPTPTVVLAHEPEIPRPARREVEGMRPLDNRRIMLQCYEAFRQFVR
ncbi:hypothetical protein BJ138DRAFT_1168049 [Hygrophoropsis aurantiaca]|uniref:Uncharacterized protein n=1 Tax=Hygrophoropsis aurantiaca TaxID=72124 RepID=A0ACB7ZRN0_9AGAM|nr:hypothetical protein BJ138DRAFT_1168049 [Hygrophoropsis aurantiaca]